MKKIYKNPTIKVVDLQTTEMIAASAEMYGKDATGTAMGRRGNPSEWEDEDEE